MTWIFIALASYFFWAIVNIGDKFLISKKIKNPYTYLITLTWAGALGFLLIPFIDFFVPDVRWLSLIAASAILYFFGSIPYFHAVKIEDISRLNILWNLIPIFTLIIAWLTIGEKLDNGQFFAFVVLVIGAIIASIHFNQQRFSFSKALPLMLISTISYGGYAVLIRYISQEVPFLVIYVWNLITVILFTSFLFLVPKIRKDFKKDIKSFDKKTSCQLMGVAALDEMGVLFNIWALSLGPAALIFALEGSQTIFVFLLAILISLFRPHIIKEELDKRNILLKLTALVVIVCGVLMLNLM